MLNRFLAGKQAEARPEKQKRPYLASECHDLNESDKWRQQILREIGKKVMEIQNAGLGEHRRVAPPAGALGDVALWAAGAPVLHRFPRRRVALPAARQAAPISPRGCRIRDLNDEINKLIREKGHWERRIVELGGPDYSKTGPKIADSEGKVFSDATGRGPGYRYFGAAKNLPGVKELFEKDAPRQVGRARPPTPPVPAARVRLGACVVCPHQRLSCRAACPVLARRSEERAARCTRRSTPTTTGSGTRRTACWRSWRPVQSWRCGSRCASSPCARRLPSCLAASPGLAASPCPPCPPKPNQAIEEWTERENKRQATEASRNTDDADGPPDSAAQQFVAYVPLPDQKAIEQRVLESKKQQLLSKYASEGLQREQADAKVLLNRKG